MWTTKARDQASADVARAIVDANRYMTLGTADAGGRPWVSPVWYATVDYREFFWVSSPESRHSRNLGERPELAIVIFDSHAPGAGQALYMSGEAAEVADTEVEDGIELFSRVSVAKGLKTWSAADVRPPGRHRLYRARASEHFVLDDRDTRVAVRLD